MKTASLEQFEGCLLGLALGDAWGAPHEGGLVERALWKFIGTTKQGELRWTDDTQMALDVADCLVANGQINPDDLAQRFAQSYHWSRGYGPGTAKVLKRIARGEAWRYATRAVYANGSLGNGAAMRVPVVGVFYQDNAPRLAEAVQLSAEVTHAHPLAIEGAQLVATATSYAAKGIAPVEALRQVDNSCQTDVFKTRCHTALNWLESLTEPTSREVARCLGNRPSAAESCVTAIYLAYRFIDDSFDALLDFAIGCRGDVDTLAAIAGAIWGTHNHNIGLPLDKLRKIEQYDRLRITASRLHEVQRAVVKAEH